MNIKLRPILILFLAVSGTIFGQLPALYFHEITGNTHGGSPTSPIYEKETLFGLTNIDSVQGYFYATTTPNAHIYKISLLNNTITDYGAAGADSAYDLKSGPMITTDGKYIIGCSANRTHVFYMDHSADPNSSSKIIYSLGHTQLKNDDVRGISSPTYYDPSPNPKFHKYVFMGMGSGDNIAKILKWDFTATLNGNTTSALTYIPCTNMGQALAGGTDFLSIGTYQGAPALYACVKSSNTDYIGIYNLNNGSWIKFIDIKTGYNLNSFNSVVNGNQIFLFKETGNGHGTVIKLNAETGDTSSKYISDWTHIYKTYYKVKDGFIYTHSCKISCDSLTVSPYSGPWTYMDSRNILVNDSLIYGAYSPESNDDKAIFKFKKSDGSLGIRTSLSEPASPKSPSGGNFITGLAVGDNQIYASLFWNGIELRGSATNPSWGVYSVGRSQADQICVVDQFRLYGLYSRPILRIYYTWTYTDIDLQDYIYLPEPYSSYHDTLQVRVTKILPLENDSTGYQKFLIGTGSSEYVAGSYARILLLKLKITNGTLETNITKVATVGPTCSVADLACLRLPGLNNYRIFLTEGAHPGVFDYQNTERFLDATLFAPAYCFNTDGILKVGNKLITSSTGCSSRPSGTAQHLWVYDLTGANAITATSDFYSAKGTEYANIDTYTPDVDGRVIDQFTNQPISGLILGNGTYPLVYCVHDGDVLYFYPNNIGTEGNYHIGRIRIPGYTSSTKLGYEITNLATDKLLSTNQSVYVSTRMGRLYYIDGNAEQDPGGSSSEKKSSKKSNYEFTLNQNYPNPFNPVTNISYSVSEKNVVQIKVFDVLGRQVTTLVNEEKEPGEYNIQFNGKSLSSGVYYYQLQSGSRITSKKFILLK